MAFHWPKFENDDPDFVECVEELAHGIVGGFAIERFQIFRIDNWFGPKWLGFCGKLVGAVGASRLGDVVVPPFVQNRLTAQSLFERTADGQYDYLGDGPQIHNDGPSTDNFQNHAKNVAPETTLIWISGNSLPNKRGSFMIYKPGPRNYMTFYLEFQKKNDEWTVSQHRDVPPAMTDFFRAQAYRFADGI